MAVEEVYHSQAESQDSASRSFVRVFECLTSDLTMGANGWGGTNVPAIGDAYPYGTWTGKVAPRCVRIEKDPRVTGTKARLTATYSAPREWGG